MFAIRTVRNDTTFQGDGKIAFVPVVVNAKQHPQTNADRIRAMTDEQLAGWFDRLTNGCDLCPIRHDCELGVESFGRCDDKWLTWLKATVEVDE